MILVDTSGLLAALFPDQREHHACVNAMLRAEGPFLLSPFVLAEVDDVITRHAGAQVSMELLEEVARGAYRLVALDARDVERAREIMGRDRTRRLSLADASIVVIAEKSGAVDVLTLDRQRFESLRSRGKRFRVLPSPTKK